MKKIALISGITGQDGSFLAELLIEKGYEVHGILRRSSSFNTGRIEHLYLDEWVRDMKKKRLVNLHYGDMTDSSSLIRIIQQVQPDEIYNLAAQSHVKVSFDVPEYTAEADVFWEWKKRQKYIRLLLQNCLVWSRKFLKKKLPPSILALRMEWRSNTVFGLLRIIVKATICLL